MNEFTRPLGWRLTLGSEESLLLTPVSNLTWGQMNEFIRPLGLDPWGVVRLRGLKKVFF